jgi:hypothetical protein
LPHTLKKIKENITRLFAKEFYNRGYGYNEYKVVGYENMTNDEIIDKCDPNNFGGRVNRYDGYAIVKVYID